MAQDVVQVVNQARDVAARFSNLQNGMSDPYEKLGKIFARWDYEVEEDAHWEGQLRMHAAAGTNMNDDDARDYQAYMSGRKGPRYLCDRLKETYQSIGFTYKAIIGVSNALSRMATAVSELALPVVRQQEKENVFRPQLGLSPDVTRANPYQAQDMQEKAEKQADLQSAYVPRNTTGPSL